MSYKEESDAQIIGRWIALIVSALVGVIVIFWGFSAVGQVYSVWSSRKDGEAELARAESNRQIKTLEARAHMESSKYLADAEIIRAQGVAEANKIIGDSLAGNEAYLRYLWIHTLGEGKNQVIYVPTEGNLPVLEAGRLK